MRDLMKRALLASYERFRVLGEKGQERLQKNQFGDITLRMDSEAEKAVIDCFIHAGLPVRVVSEEHGTFDIGAPEFLLVLDGIDGTALYLHDRHAGHYGTMVGLFRGLDPTYNDYIAGGIMQHASGTLFLGIKDASAFISVGGQETYIHTSGNLNFDQHTVIYVDEYFEENRRIFSKPLEGFNTSYHQASAMYYAALVEGKADVVCECTRKGNLELAAAYGLVREAGGVMMDLQGQDVGGRKYGQFGMQEEHVPVVSAASRELGNKFVAFITAVR